jgi:hypothetical protein
LKSRTKWKLSGLEGSSAAAEEALSKGYQVFNATLEQAVSVPEISKGYDLIYLGQGIECFNEPRARLRTLAILLNLGGYLVLRTPNLDSEQRKLFGPAWAHWKSKKTQFVYSRRSLIKLLEQAGFSLTKLQTISELESTALSFKQLEDQPASNTTGGNYPKIPETLKAEGITRVNHLFWDKLGKGDEIRAVFRRVS